jgi:hypothetical protein
MSDHIILSNDDLINKLVSLSLHEIKQYYNNSVYEYCCEKVMLFIIDNYGLDGISVNDLDIEFDIIDDMNLSKPSKHVSKLHTKEVFEKIISLFHNKKMYIDFINTNYEFLHIYSKYDDYTDIIFDNYEKLGGICIFFTNPTILSDMNSNLFEKLMTKEDFRTIVEKTKKVNGISLFNYLCLHKKEYDSKLRVLTEFGIFEKVSILNSPHLVSLFYDLNKQHFRKP